MRSVWGVHNDSLDTELVEGGFISVGWDALVDLSSIGTTREQLKAALAEAYPDDKPRAIAGWAGNLLRFAAEISEGDVVVAPYRPNSTINIGVISGPYEFHPAVPTHRHRRAVRWEKLEVSRTVFSQPALYEIGSLLTVFGVRKHAQEFLAVLGAASETEFETAVREVEASPESDYVGAADEPRASRIERHTRDFVLERLKHSLTQPQLVYLARGADHTHTTPDRNEAERVAWFDLAEAMAMIERGEIVGAATVVGIYGASLPRDGWLRTSSACPTPS